MTLLNGANIFAVSMFFIFLDIIAVAGRFCSRISRRSGLALDDWLCLPALAMTIGCGALLIYGSLEHSVGYHTVPPKTHEQAEVEITSAMLISKLKLFVAFSLISTLAIGLIKLAFLFCYRRIFSGVAFSYINWMMVAVVTAWTLTFFIAAITACGRYVSLLWQVGQDSSQCVNTWDLTLVMTITDFAIDIFIMVLPLPWVWRLNMSLVKKFAVSGVFLTGAVATVAGVIRMVVVIKMYTFDQAKETYIFGLYAGKKEPDTLGILSFILFWSYIEIGVGMFVCCLPSLRLLFDQVSLSSVAGRAMNGARSRVAPSATSSTETRSTKSSIAKSLLQSPKPSSEAIFESSAIPKSPSRPDKLGPRGIGVVRDVEVYAESV